MVRGGEEKGHIDSKENGVQCWPQVWGIHDISTELLGL